MRKAKQQVLEAHGWRVGSVAEFLDLTPEEAAVVELKLRLSDALRARRASAVEAASRPRGSVWGSMTSAGPQ